MICSFGCKCTNFPLKKEVGTFFNAPTLLLNFDFLFHVYFFALRVGKFILKEGETLIGDNLDTESVFHLPFSLHGNKALVDKGSDVRVDV